MNITKRIRRANRLASKCITRLCALHNASATFSQRSKLRKLAEDVCRIRLQLIRVNRAL